MFNVVNPPGNDNPRQTIGNAPETIKVPGVEHLVPRGVIPLALGLWPVQCPAAPRSGMRVTRDRLTALAAVVPAATAVTAAWLTGLPRRAGRHLFALNDAEAGWHHWQVTETLGGLGRQYRDLRFDALKADDTLRRDPVAEYQARPDRNGCPLSGEGLWRPAGPRDPTTRA
jgi:hypothetical protein